MSIGVGPRGASSGPLSFAVQSGPVHGEREGARGVPQAPRDQEGRGALLEVDDHGARPVGFCKLGDPEVLDDGTGKIAIKANFVRCRFVVVKEPRAFEPNAVGIVFNEEGQLRDAMYARPGRHVMGTGIPLPTGPTAGWGR